ncbi:palmdelphin-like isoform X1 [Puntigrus tetrazona]|uniref:palmdelphin-like isoform X1 n=1 Tax=Puntigrus tetrazona TaxID=1606681 RepID=UPI001C892180|nr:palmdelphin-like isoform X1 [Puntigrus tetrazona]
MEEETLLRERLQAITDKRRLREEIEKKRRNIEEEKLKLQYLKKKTLREQWLMDGLSTLSEEEQESVKAQTEDNQQQTKLLQSNVDRIEQEIAVLETQELELSAKEEILLKQLKEVEKTPEDIIKRCQSDCLGWENTCNLSSCRHLVFPDEEEMDRKTDLGGKKNNCL